MRISAKADYAVRAALEGLANEPVRVVATFNNHRPDDPIDVPDNAVLTPWLSYSQVMPQADLVICQTGCISHSAYWRVKDHCKRHGKRCVFVDNPSVSSLVRGLQEVATEETQPN